VHPLRSSAHFLGLGLGLNNPHPGAGPSLEAFHRFVLDLNSCPARAGASTRASPPLSPSRTDIGERVCESVRECFRESERVRECVQERERESVCVSVCVRERESMTEKSGTATERMM